MRMVAVGLDFGKFIQKGAILSNKQKSKVLDSYPKCDFFLSGVTSPTRSFHGSCSTLVSSLQSQIGDYLSHWLCPGIHTMEAGKLNPGEGDLEAGDLDGLIKRFLHLKQVQSPDLDGSYQEDDDELFKPTAQNTSACDYQWFNDELGSVPTFLLTRSDRAHFINTIFQPQAKPQVIKII